MTSRRAGRSRAPPASTRGPEGAFPGRGRARSSDRQRRCRPHGARRRPPRSPRTAAGSPRLPGSAEHADDPLTQGALDCHASRRRPAAPPSDAFGPASLKLYPGSRLRKQNVDTSARLGSQALVDHARQAPTYSDVAAYSSGLSHLGDPDGRDRDQPPEVGLRNRGGGISTITSPSGRMTAPRRRAASVTAGRAARRCAAPSARCRP